jgi:integrase/recombinase XerD
LISFATLVTQFLDRPGLAPKTQQSYELTLMPLLQQYGQNPIETLSRPILETYLNGLNHLAYTTHQRHQAILQALFNFAVEQGHLSTNPIGRLPRRKPDATRQEYASDQIIRYLTPEQLQQLYQAIAPDIRLNAVVHLLHRTGARIAELLALNLEAVDLRERKFQVIGKGNKQRWCFYSEDASRSLERYLRHYRHADCEALFTAQQPLTKKVSRLSYRTIYTCWQQLTEPEPLLQGVRMHDLRHTFATERVGLMGIEELRALMGHQNIQTTLRYQKVTSGRAEVAAQNAFKLLKIGGDET